MKPICVIPSEVEVEPKDLI